MKINKVRMMALLAGAMLMLCWICGAFAQAAGEPEALPAAELAEEQKLPEENNASPQESIAEDVTAQITLGPVEAEVPENTPAPEATPVVTEAPMVTKAPEVTKLPEVTEVTEEPAPEATKAPEVTEEPAPEAAKTPEVTEEPAPEATKTPEVTEEPAPEATKTPKVTEEPAPEAAKSPEVTEEPAPEATKIPEVTEEPAPEATRAPEASEESAPESTAAPVPATPAPAATAAPFASGYAYAPKGLEVYSARMSKEETLLLTIEEDGYVCVLELYGEDQRWARICLAYEADGETGTMDGYVRFNRLTPEAAADQAAIKAKLESGTHATYGSTPLQVLAAVLNETAAGNSEAAEPSAEETTEASEPTAPAASTEESSEAETGESSEITAPAASTEESSEAEPTESTAPTTPFEELSEQPTIPAAPTTPEPALQELPEEAPAVTIVIHAGETIHEGDTITLEAVATGFDHEPVYIWEYQIPGEEGWYVCEEANGATFTFVVNRYNSYFNWRVCAE